MSHSLAKRLARALLPPFLAESVRMFRRRWNPVLEYSPTGWDNTRIPPGSTGWNAGSVVDATQSDVSDFYRTLKLGGPLGSGHQHNLHVSFAYVLARAAFGKDRLGVLDWGAGLGHYFHVARAALPELPIDYHCTETRVLADAGRRAVPEACWHSDDSYLGRKYDVVMLSGSLQYAENWPLTLKELSQCAAEWLYVTRLPVVEIAPTYAAVQRSYGTTMLHWQFNRREFLETVAALGFSVVREFETGDRPYVKNAPEQCELRGWLFRRQSDQTSKKDSH